MPNRQHEVVDDDLTHAGGRREQRKQCLSHAAQEPVRMADAWLITELLDPRNLGVIGECMKSACRQVEVNRMERAVEVERGLALDVVDDGVARAQGGNRCGSAILPLFVALEQLEMHAKDEGILFCRRPGQNKLWFVVAQFGHREGGLGQRLRCERTRLRLQSPAECVAVTVAV